MAAKRAYHIRAPATDAGHPRLRLVKFSGGVGDCALGQCGPCAARQGAGPALRGRALASCMAARPAFPSLEKGARTAETFRDPTGARTKTDTRTQPRRPDRQCNRTRTDKRPRIGLQPVSWRRSRIDIFGPQLCEIIEEFPKESFVSRMPFAVPALLLKIFSCVPSTPSASS